MTPDTNRGGPATPDRPAPHNQNSAPAKRRKSVVRVSPRTVTSRALRWAQIDLKGARQELDRHQKNCLACRPTGLCPAGQALVVTVTEAAAAVQDEKRLAAAPLPGQMMMDFESGDWDALVHPPERGDQ